MHIKDVWQNFFLINLKKKIFSTTSPTDLRVNFFIVTPASGPWWLNIDHTVEKCAKPGDRATLHLIDEEKRRYRNGEPSQFSSAALGGASHLYQEFY